MTSSFDINSLDPDKQRMLRAGQPGWTGRAAPSPAERAAHAALRAQATETRAAIIETLPHYFAKEPRQLDALETDGNRPRLSRLARYPHQLRQRIAELIGEEVATPRRMDMAGGQTIMINLRAAMRYAERLCDAEPVVPRGRGGKFARAAE